MKFQHLAIGKVFTFWSEVMYQGHEHSQWVKTGKTTYAHVQSGEQHTIKDVTFIVYPDAGE